MIKTGYEIVPTEMAGVAAGCPRCFASAREVFDAVKSLCDSREAAWAASSWCEKHNNVDKCVGERYDGYYNGHKWFTIHVVAI